ERKGVCILRLPGRARSASGRRANRPPRALAVWALHPSCVAFEPVQPVWDYSCNPLEGKRAPILAVVPGSRPEPKIFCFGKDNVELLTSFRTPVVRLRP